MDEGRYELKEEIARGGMGVVLRVRDIDLDRTMAMKRMESAPDERRDLPRRNDLPDSWKRRK